jgi:hypothetical protein
MEQRAYPSCPGEGRGGQGGRACRAADPLAGLQNPRHHYVTENAAGQKPPSSLRHRKRRRAKTLSSLRHRKRRRQSSQTEYNTYSAAMVRSATSGIGTYLSSPKVAGPVDLDRACLAEGLASASRNVHTHCLYKPLRPCRIRPSSYRDGLTTQFRV